jgi:hypothetical protein
MPVSIRWSDPRRQSLLLTFTAPWTWDQYEALSGDIDAAFDSVPHTVDLVIDVTEAGTLPEDALFRLRNSYSSPIVNIGEYIFVGATDEFKKLFEAADRYYTALVANWNIGLSILTSWRKCLTSLLNPLSNLERGRGEVIFPSTFRTR